MGNEMEISDSVDWILASMSAKWVPDKTKSTVVWGAGQFAVDTAKAALAAGCKIVGFCLSNEVETKEINGLPVMGLAEAAETADEVLVGIFNHNEECAWGGLARAFPRPEKLVFPISFYRNDAFAKSLGWRYWLSDTEQYKDRRDGIIRAAGILADNESRRVFFSILRFRLGIDLDAGSGDHGSEQYFPPILASAVKKGGVVVDIGAFDGDTLKTAAKALNPSLAIAFEPDDKAFSRLCLSASEMNFPVITIPLAVGAKKETVFMDFMGNGSSRISDEQAGTPLMCSPLDMILHNTIVDVIKMDIEGHERDAIKGAAKTLQKHAPAMAVAGYHLWDDLWEIPVLLADAVPSRKIYLREHGSNSFDFVFFAI